MEKVVAESLDAVHTHTHITFRKWGKRKQK